MNPTHHQRRFLNQPAACFILVLLALLCVGRTKMMRDPGTLWHTIAGEKMLRAHGVIRTDPFSFTHAADDWPAQQWLGECAMALVHRFAGLDGLLLGAAAIIAMIFSIAAARAARIGLAGPVTVLLMMVTAATASYHFMPRPHLATLLFMTTGTGLLCDVESGRVSRRYLLFVPAAIALWTNIHGGALGGVASLILVAVGWLLFPRRGFFRLRDTIPRVSPAMLAVACAGAGAALLLNPFGPTLPRVWVSLMTSSLIPKVIIEHGATRLTSPEGIMIVLMGAAYLAILLRSSRDGVRVTWLLPLVWFVLALSRVRHGPIFAFVSAVIILDMLPHAQWGRLFSHDADSSAAGFDTRSRGSWRPMALPTAIVALALGLMSLGIRAPIIGADWCRLDPNYWPVDATRSLNQRLKRHPEECRIFNDMRFGGFLIYQAPETRVYIDDRCELYRDEGLRRYLEILKTPMLIEGEAVGRGINFALVRSGTPLAAYLAGAANWNTLHRDAVASLYERTPTVSLR